MQVKITQVGPAEYIVAATVGSKSAAMALAGRMLEVNPAAFVPVAPLPPALEAGPPLDPPEGVIPHAIAEAMRRDIPPPEDDEGEAIPGYRCATGVCAGD